MGAALLLEQSATDVRKGLVALRYVRRHFVPDGLWADRIAIETGRELLAYEEIDEDRAAKASS